MFLPYKFPLMLIVFGAALLALVWNVEIAWISWPVGIVAIFLVIAGLAWANLVADAQYEAYIQQSQADRSYTFQPELTTQKLLYYPLITFASILVYTITISGAKVENYLDWRRFMLEVVIIGTLAGIGAVWLYTTKYTILFTNNKWEDHIKVALFLIPLLSVLHTSIWYNHLQPSRISRVAKGVITSDGRKYVHIAFEGQEQRFTFGRAFDETLHTGDSVLLTIKEGALGYPFVSKLSRLK